MGDGERRVKGFASEKAIIACLKMLKLHKAFRRQPFGVKDLFLVSYLEGLRLKI